MANRWRRYNLDNIVHCILKPFNKLDKFDIKVYDKGVNKLKQSGFGDYGNTT